MRSVDLAGRQLHLPSKTLSLLAAGPLALVLVAGCGSSGSDSSGSLPVVSSEASSAPASVTPEPSETESPSETPTEDPTESPSDTPSESTSADGNEFTDSASGLSLKVPDDYVLVTTAAEAKSKLPAVFETATDGADRITKIQQQLAASTVFFAVAPADDSFNDNIGLQKTDASGLTDPAQIQSASFKVKAREALTNAGATAVTLVDTELGGKPAVHVTYTLNTTPAVSGQQYYVSAGDEKVYILTVSAGSKARSEAAASTVTDSWTFS